MALPELEPGRPARGLVTISTELKVYFPLSLLICFSRLVDIGTKDNSLIACGLNRCWSTPVNVAMILCFPKRKVCLFVCLKRIQNSFESFKSV
jgi:hypothetical protein